MGAKLSSEVKTAVEYWQNSTMSVPAVAKRYNIHHTTLYRAIERLKAKRVKK